MATDGWQQARAHRSRLRVLEEAVALFAERGYDETTFHDVAARAGVSAGLACRYFPTKEHLALALYDRLADDLAAWAAQMPRGTIAERFEATMRAKLTLLEPHRRALLALVARALDPQARAGVLSDATDAVRSKVSGVFALAVCGATDAPAREEAARVARLLYAAHLALVLVWTQDRSDRGRAAQQAVTLAREALETLSPLLALATKSPIASRVDDVLRRLVGPSKLASGEETARKILARVFRRRRALPGVPAEPSEAALALHLPRVRAFVEAGEPVQLVLPAFPAKAPNLQKVLGARPDMAEQLALESLSTLLDDIGEAYAPGARLVICSDGHVFADLVGVKDDDVVRYRADLEAMIAELGGDRIRVFDLADAFGDASPAAARRTLLERYGRDEGELRALAKHAEGLRAQIDGIHRFLFEDEIARHPSQSRTQARKQTRDRAIEVVRRSDAWGRLVSAVFPRALRLSIHPQPDVSEKIGVHLLATDDAWLTPWHGVALLEGERFRLVRRKDAEARGATVALEDGRPSYMEVRA